MTHIIKISYTGAILDEFDTPEEAYACLKDDEPDLELNDVQGVYDMGEQLDFTDESKLVRVNNPPFLWD